MPGPLSATPAYEGDEPYVYFAFAETDARRVRPILRVLYARGFRVWYVLGPAGSAQAVLRRSERASSAALTIVYLSDAAVGDRDLKSALLVNQKNERPILCLDPDGTDRRLAMGLREDIPHLGLYANRGDALEEALIRAEGVTQELMGQPVQLRSGFSVGKLSAVLALLAAGMLLFTIYGGRYLSRSASADADTISFSDPIVMAAARQAVGGGALTEESAAAVTILRLDSLPESWEDLALLPALEAMELPQDALIGSAPLPGGYRILLSGGERP